MGDDGRRWLSLATGLAKGVSFPLATMAVRLWNAAIYLDSSALAAGTVQASEKHLWGATMGLHSMAGYAGGFLGPLGVGLALDLSGGDGVLGWGLAFGHLAVVTLGGLAVLRRLGRVRPEPVSGQSRPGSRWPAGTTPSRRCRPGEHCCPDGVRPALPHGSSQAVPPPPACSTRMRSGDDRRSGMCA